jgi:hypothetical protein
VRAEDAAIVKLSAKQLQSGGMEKPLYLMGSVQGTLTNTWTPSK